MKKKKVLFIATVVKIHIMVFHIPYLEWFKKQGYEVHVAARNDYENQEDCNIPFCDEFIDLPFERQPLKMNNIKVGKQLERIINDNEYDIVHCHTPMGGVLGRWAARTSKSKILYTAHGFHFYEGSPLKNWLLFYPIERFLSNYTDILITINEEDYTRAQKLKAKQVKSIPGVGIDLQKFIPQTKEKKQLLRKEYKIVQNDFILLYVAELSDRKNQMILLKSMKKIEKTHPNIKLLLAGQGENRQLYEKYLEENNLKNVSILGFRNDVENLMQLSDVAVSSSKQEGLPVNILEAMATGLPVIASDVRGNRDLIDDKKGGLLFNPRNVNQLSEHIITMLNNESFRETASNYNIEKVKQFSLENVIDEMSKIY